MKKAITIIVTAMSLISCWDDTCWECQNVMVDGIISEVCWEVDCNDLSRD